MNNETKHLLGMNNSKLTLICGPCVMESYTHLISCAESLLELAEKHDINLIFKSSFDKANRSSSHSFRGVGIEKGMEYLQEIKSRFSIPVTTDIHLPEQASIVGQVVDIIQIPAFLARQTDLLSAAAHTGRIVNVKKGQFMAPWDMKHVVEKLKENGCENYILTDRGTSFGYNMLVSDMRSIPIMQGFNCPVCFDVTHSLQTPASLGNETGSTREFAPHLAKAAVAVGADILFIEAHNSPDDALCDAKAQLSFTALDELLPQLIRIFNAVSH